MRAGLRWENFVVSYCSGKGYHTGEVFSAGFVCGLADCVTKLTAGNLKRLLTVLNASVSLFIDSCNAGFCSQSFSFGRAWPNKLAVALRLAIDKNNVAFAEEQVGMIGYAIGNFRIFNYALHQIGPPIDMLLCHLILFMISLCHCLSPNKLICIFPSSGGYLE